MGKGKTIYDYLRRAEPKFNGWLQNAAPEVFNALKDQHVALGKDSNIVYATASGEVVQAFLNMKAKYPTQFETLMGILKKIPTS